MPKQSKQIQVQNDHKADQNNVNTGTPGVNETYAKKHGNRGKQLNPNQKKE